MYAQTLESSAYPGIRLTHDDGHIRFWGNGTEKWGIGSSGDVTNNFILYDVENTAVRLLINENTGNVGIGSTNPVATSELNSLGTLLHVRSNNATGDVEVARFQGGLDADNTAAVVRINHSNDRGLYLKGGRRIGDQSFAELGVIGTSGNLESPSIAFDDSGNVGIGTTSPSQKLEVSNGSILATNLTNDRSISIQPGNGSIEFNGVNSALHINRFSPLNIGLVTGGGKVGIGTATPTEKLTVDGGINNTVGSGGTITLFDNDVNKKNRVILGADESGAYIQSTWGNGGTDAISFRNSSNEAEMTITNDGNIGMGTTVPDEKLTVNGKIHTQEGSIQKVVE